mmetsp:Transcript_93702/g.268167  ORF Transcript_93702/g.268167 Transcript_93702/m.268167 type:complete len:557 (+) Transcript_93702:242-1912(+)
MASSFLGFDVLLICGEGSENNPRAVSSHNRTRSIGAAGQGENGLTGLFPGQGPVGRPGRGRGVDGGAGGGEDGGAGFMDRERETTIVFSEDEESEDEGDEERDDGGALLRWGVVHEEDEEAEDGEGARGEAHRVHAWPQRRPTDQRNWARDAVSGSPVPRLIYVHEDRLRLCFLLQDGMARTMMLNARRQFEKLAKDLASCTKASAFKKSDFLTKSVYFLPESSWHISCATLITRTTMDVWPSAQGAIALLEDMLNTLKAPTINYSNGSCRVCDDGTMVVSLDDGGWTKDFRLKLEQSGLGKGKGSKRDGIPHMRLAPRQGESSHASKCVAVVGRLFLSEDLSDKDLAKVKKVLKAFANKQNQQRVSGGATQGVQAGSGQGVAQHTSSVRPGGGGGGGVSSSRGWRSSSARPNTTANVTPLNAATPASPATATTAASGGASGGGPLTSTADSSPVPPDTPTSAHATPPPPPPGALASRPTRRATSGRSRSMVPFSFNTTRSSSGNSSVARFKGRGAGCSLGSGNGDLELSVLSMVREQVWCMAQYVLEGEFELEAV